MQEPLLQQQPAQTPKEDLPSRVQQPSAQLPSNCSEVVVHLTGECAVNNSVTPIRIHLRGYFTKLLQKNKQKRSQRVDQRKVKPHFYGEALTVDEVYERMVAEEEEKKREAESKKRAAEERKAAAVEKKREAAKKKKAAEERKKVMAYKKNLKAKGGQYCSFGVCDSATSASQC